MPYGYVDIAYSQKLTMTAFNYTPPSPVFSITDTLPAGLGFMADTLLGTPTVTDIFYLAVQAMDANGFAASYNYYPLKVRIETTPPVITPSVTGKQGTNGKTLTCQATSKGGTASRSPPSLDYSAHLAPKKPGWGVVRVWVDLFFSVYRYSKSQAARNDANQLPSVIDEDGLFKLFAAITAFLTARCTVF